MIQAFLKWRRNRKNKSWAMNTLPEKYSPKGTAIGVIQLDAIAMSDPRVPTAIYVLGWRCRARDGARYYRAWLDHDYDELLVEYELWDVPGMKTVWKAER